MLFDRCFASGSASGREPGHRLDSVDLPFEECQRPGATVPQTPGRRSSRGRGDVVSDVGWVRDAGESEVSRSRGHLVGLGVHRFDDGFELVQFGEHCAEALEDLLVGEQVTGLDQSHG